MGRWQLAHELASLRGDRPRDHIAKAIDVAPSSITRWEDPSGAIPRRRDLQALLDFFGVAGEDARRFMDLREQARESGWWQRYGIKGGYGTYIGLESAARKIQRYDAVHIPGLFQAEEYQRALMAGSMPEAGKEEIESRVQVRMERQRVWAENRPQTWAIIDEAAIHRVVGGVEVMRKQLEHVVSLMEEPHVTVQLLPYEVGAHAAMETGPFTVLDVGRAQCRSRGATQERAVPGRPSRGGRTRSRAR
nr:DUF5753 domain-containing protein [Allosalinactinospora lopnorensis]